MRVCVCVLGVFFPVCGGLRDTSPSPLVQASLPLATSKTCSPLQPCHQWSKQRYRIIDGLPSKETALLLSHFSGVQWCLFWFNVHSIPHRRVYSYDLEVNVWCLVCFLQLYNWPGEITIIAHVYFLRGSFLFKCCSDDSISVLVFPMGRQQWPRNGSISIMKDMKIKSHCRK